MHASVWLGSTPADMHSGSREVLFIVQCIEEFHYGVKPALFAARKNSLAVSDSFMK
jgi:hypothetical protein